MRLLIHRLKQMFVSQVFFFSFFFGEWLSVAIKGFLVTTGNPRTVLLDKVVK